MSLIRRDPLIKHEDNSGDHVDIKASPADPPNRATSIIKAEPKRERVRPKKADDPRENKSKELILE